MNFEKPIFIVSAPRAGSSMLLELLTRSPSVYTIGIESHELFERIQGLGTAQRNFESNRLTAVDASPDVAQQLRDGFAPLLRDRAGRYAKAGTVGVRMLEKTPKYALRIPFLNAVFPDALFIYLYREPRGNISSIIDAWRSKQFVTYPRLPGWQGDPAETRGNANPGWSLLLIPEWQKLNGKPLPEIAAAQWSAANRFIMDDLAALPPERWCAVNYADVLEDPQEQAIRLCAFCGIAWDQTVKTPLPNARYTLTPPDSKKWEKNAVALGSVLPHVQELADRAQRTMAQRGAPAGVQPPPAPESASPAAPAPQEGQSDTQPLQSVHTTSFPELLEKLGASVLVSTYQAGKLIAARSINGVLNTHFLNFPSPMGLACDGQRLAIGTAMHVWDFRNQPDVGQKLEPVGKVDACYLPRTVHFTGDIRVHEIAWSGEDLWIVNTRFSCLCTLDKKHSFVPRWRPKFISSLAPEDRCHLNGMALQAGRPKYVTVLGQTDTPGAWRQNKASGGMLLDVATSEPLCTGLSMPHSPRLYADRLWILESGYGRLSTVDIKTGKTTTVAEVPGFTRGLDFIGPFAFVGLSQIRESSTFNNLPIIQTLKERICGVWVIDIRSGQIVAFLRFEGAVQEIFAVQILPGIRVPEIINENDQIIGNSFVLPDEALKEVRFSQTPV
jgi:uncharacterized protein (TIGR03032 family)